MPTFRVSPVKSFFRLIFFAINWLRKVFKSEAEPIIFQLNRTKVKYKNKEEIVVIWVWLGQRGEVERPKGNSKGL